MVDRVAIVASAKTGFSPSRSDANYSELAYEVIEKVLSDTGLTIGDDIDNSISCSHDIWDGQTISNIGITDVIGGHLRNEEKMAMDGSTAVYYGTIGILSGEFNLTLLLAHTKMSQTNRNIVNNDAFEPIFTRKLGLDYTSAAALQATRYMHVHGIKRDQVAKVAVKNLGNASRNETAHNFGFYSVEDIIESPVLATPITEKEMAPDTDGAVAMILASEKAAKKITKNPVWVKGIGTSYDSHYLGDRDLAMSRALEQAADRAYAMAGIKDPAKDVDVFEIGEEFAHQELMWYEGLRLCEPGRAGELIDSGRTLFEGDIPINPSGGLLGGVPINVAGLHSVAEVFLQLRGEAGRRQVKDAGVAVVQGQSGHCGQHHCVIVLGRD